MRFADRREAGKLLGQAVVELGPVEPLVAALPRGGVPVGFEVAAALGCELDVIVVRKVGVPFQPELAMGAVGEGGVVIRNEAVIAATRVSDSEFGDAAAAARTELASRLAEYRSAVPAVDPEGRTVIVADDGLATGSTAAAALTTTRERGAAAVWLAVPVAPRDTADRMREYADELVVLHTPRRFMAVGVWYLNFSQTSNEEVTELLRQSRG